MKAVLLAAGKGTRMKHLTQEMPKPMLPVQGRPILEHILTGLIETGIREFFIVTKHCAEVVESHFGDGSKWGVRIEFGRQGDLDGTGKAVEPARGFVGSEPFLLTYGDILVKPGTYRGMLERFAGGTFSGLLTVTRGEDVRKGGINFFDDEFCLRRVVEKPSDAQLDELRATGWLKPGAPAWYNAGIYIFAPVVFEHIAQLQPSPRGEYELTDALSTMVEAGERIAGLQIADRWVDVRDPETLGQLERGEL
ncbi:MAG: NTP transferase domain-containing protein [Verrucomicrobiales bacterium]|nr:NTP transferase domain-containing protein [Verrucomicrobiales bacterium]